ncbi:MAG: redox-regulated ATPase YchF [Anaerolineales bacterium]|nr:redox-regulated ATPase YchF [Anaerolineales bacterium]
MSLSIGIVGLPNVGKSTTFNALTGAQNAVVANYPFCTIQPNRAVVPLPDSRLDRLAELVKVPTAIHATLEFVDIAGLVQDAHKGEGLGNKFLAQIRETAAILHIVRCFEDPNVVHIREKPYPVLDIEIVEVELALADLQQLERKIERLVSAVKGDKKLQPMMDLCEALKDHLGQGLPASSFRTWSSDDPVERELMSELNHEMRFLTGKPVIYVANVAECDLAENHPYVQALQEYAARKGAQVVVLCSQLEQDMQDMSPEERREYLALSGIEESGLEQVIRKSFDLLKLISFFTFNENEARAWNIPRGATAPRAAGAIHTDFERGFIRAEVIPFPEFARCGSSAAAKAAGHMRLEGKEYIVQDGDVIYFRFNV